MVHNILFKRQADYPDIERDFSKLDHRLARIVYTLAAIVWALHRDYLVVTRIYEPKDDGSTHHRQNKNGPYRFIDIAMLYHMPQDEQEVLRACINMLFPYDVQRLRDTVQPFGHGTADHWHLQVRA